MNYVNKLLLVAFVCLAAPLVANADLPGKHPAYLHALSDLRSARWMLEHRPGGAAVSGQEDVAITEIDKAIGEIKKAAIDDGKNVNDHPAVDVPADNPGRLHKALELLHKVHSDISREEDDPAVLGLRDRALGHVHNAVVATKTALTYAGQPH
jgi:hypothetical protein